MHKAEKIHLYKPNVKQFYKLILLKPIPNKTLSSKKQKIFIGTPPQISDSYHCRGVLLFPPCPGRSYILGEDYMFCNSIAVKCAVESFHPII